MSSQCIDQSLGWKQRDTYATNSKTNQILSANRVSACQVDSTVVNAIVGNFDTINVTNPTIGVWIYAPDSITGNSTVQLDPSYPGAILTSSFIFPSNTEEDAGTRLAFDYSKGAIRAGTVSGTQWNSANRGLGSVAFGVDTTASDSYTTVSGGNGNSATGLNSTVGGGSGNAASSLNGTVSGGATNIASGLQNSTVAGGAANTASNSQATVSGGSANIASGASSTVIGGNANTASGTFSISGGDSSVASNNASIALGEQCNATGQQSVALGNTCTASGNQSFAVGNICTASGPQSFAIGNNAVATANQSVAIGDNAVCNGSASFAINTGAVATTDNTLSMGFLSNANSQYSSIIGGQNNTISGGVADRSSILGGNNNTISLAATNSIILGGNTCTSTGAGSLLAGVSASDGGNANCVVFGGAAGATPTLANQFVIGQGAATPIYLPNATVGAAPGGAAVASLSIRIGATTYQLALF